MLLYGLAACLLEPDQSPPCPLPAHAHLYLFPKTLKPTPPHARRVSDVMTSKPITVSRTTNINDATRCVRVCPSGGG